MFAKLNIFPIIGLCGKAGAGKDTVAEFLWTDFRINRVAFASALKDRAIKEFGLSYEQCYGDEKEIVIPEYNKSPRQILQLMGTEWYRSIDDKFWLRQVYNQISNDLSHYYTGVCITDVRFPNEIDFVKEIGGVTVKITRPNHQQTIHTQHASETNIDSMICDYEIINDGSKSDLQHKIKLLMRQVMEKK